MSIFPSLSSRQIKTDTIAIQYSDKSSLKAYQGHKRDISAHGLELLVHVQIGLGLSVAYLIWLLLVGSLGSVLLEMLEMRG